MRRRRSRLDARQTRALLEHFVSGTPARPAARAAGVHRNTAVLFYLKLRELIARQMAWIAPFDGPIGLDAIEGDEADKETLRRTHPRALPLIGLIAHDNATHCVIVAHGGGVPTGRTRLRLESIIEPGLVRLALAPPACEGTTGREAPEAQSVAVVDNFLRYGRQQLRRFNGIPRQHLFLFLKECEWRLNYGPHEHLLHILTRWFEQDTD